MDEGGIVDIQADVLAGRRMTACGIVLSCIYLLYLDFEHVFLRLYLHVLILFWGQRILLHDQGNIS